MPIHRLDRCLRGEDHADQRGVEVFVLIGDISERDEDIRRRRADPGHAFNKLELNLHFRRDWNEQRSIVGSGLDALNVEGLGDIFQKSH